jgi:uncharacterized protein
MRQDKHAVGNEQAGPPAPKPWWTFGHVWLVIAGPTAVIVAGVVTAWIAVSSPDPLLAQDYYRRGIEINKQLTAEDKARIPALQGRNHAATPAPTR